MSDDETKEYSVLFRNPKVTELFKLCIQPETRKEMQHALLDFCDKFAKIQSSHSSSSVSMNEAFYEFDVAIMYALHYNYEHHSSASLSAVARSLHAYSKQVQFLLMQGNNRNVLTNCENARFLSVLRLVTDFSYSEKKGILENAVIHSILGGSYGLTKFLVKFGLVHFPLEIDENGKTLVTFCVYLFNIWNRDQVGDISFDAPAPVQVDDILNRMQQNKDITFRRSMFILCKFFHFFDYIRFDDGPEHKQVKCFALRKLLCLQVLVETTAEQDITLKDIEYFLQTFLSGHLNAEVWSYFQKRYNELFSDGLNYHCTRSLKDLCRCRIRKCLLSSTKMLPELVRELPIPTSLEEYLFFEYKGIWEALIDDQQLIFDKVMFSYDTNIE